MTGDWMPARRGILVGVGLLLLTTGVYYPGLDVRMVADDFRIVERLTFDDAFRSLRETVGYDRNEYRPLVAFSFALSNALWRGDPRGYHLESISLHALNVVLLFSWLLLLTRSTTISGVAAVLFAVHPINHARVVWIAARDSLLSTLFMLMALIAYTLARRRNDHASVKTPGAAIALIILSLGFFILSLVSYEGAVILPGILAGLEFFLFARPVRGVWGKLRTAAVKTLPHTIALCIYLAWWTLLFHGRVGQDYLSYGVGNLLRNYYSLLYQLFHGNEHLAGFLYFILVLLGLLLPRERRLVVWFSLLFMLLAFLPFVIVTGFASRFAYASAIGYASLVALLLSACTFQRRTGSIPTLRFIPLPLAAVIFFALAANYTIDLRARISEWKIAGEIADGIPRQIKACHPDLPDGSTLVLARIPRMYGHAYVYPLGLKSSIERFYPGRNLQVFYGPGEMNEITEGRNIESRETIFFKYVPDERGIEEVIASQR